MANINAIRGLRPYKQDGHSGQVQGKPHWFDGGTTLALGDAVTSAGTGANYLEEVIPVTGGSGNQVKGVVTGWESLPGDITHGSAKKYLLASAADARVVYVNTDLDQIYRIQADTAVEYADIGLNCNVTNDGVDTDTGASGYHLDSADVTAIADTAAFQFRIVGFPQDVLNEPNAANNDILVQINTGTKRAGTTGI